MASRSRYAGASLIALAGLVYSAAMAWTLSFAYRRGAASALQTESCGLRQD